MTAQPPVSSIVPPPSSHYAFVHTRKILTYVLNLLLLEFFYLFFLKLHTVKVRKLGSVCTSEMKVLLN
jgi:hypothetical protein